MRTLKILVLSATMAVMLIFGGMITASVAADDEVIEEPEVIEEVETEEPEVEEVEAEEPEIEEIEEPEVEEPEVEVNEDLSNGEIITRDTGLVVDDMELVDSYGNWSFWYCQCDGDLYAITIKGEHVGVCQILN